MAFTWHGFWVDAPPASRTKGTAANMNKTMAGSGPIADFPAANTCAGAFAYATDEHIVYYSDGAVWQVISGRDLADMLERDHANLTNVTSDQHHARAHALNSALDHSAATQGDTWYAGAAGAPALLPAGTSGYFLKTQGAGANPIWASVPVKVVRKTANETVNNSSALQNDDDLLWAVLANEVWAFYLYIRHASGVTPDIKFGWAYPVGTTMSWIQGSPGTSLVEMTETSVDNLTTNGTEQIVIYQGLVVVGGTAGNINLKWAQNLANASNTIVRANSYLILRQLA